VTLVPFTCDPDLVRPDGVDPGRSPKLDWLPINNLVVNDEYQRPISISGKKNIFKIMQQFSWSRFSPVICREVPGKGLYEIIDGQHRTTAAFNMGYDAVPAMIVSCSDEEAARIFAAVNGTIMRMSPLAVYKAALAGGEQWAVECREAAEAAGCEILRYPIARKHQRPLQTMAVTSIRRVHAVHGPAILKAAFRLLAASQNSHALGFLSSYLITQWSRIIASRPGWAGNVDSLVGAVKMLAINLTLIQPQDVEQQILRKIGDGRQSSEAANTIKAKVRELLERSKCTSAGLIATQLRLPYAQVDRLIAEIKAEREAS
jgi:hypothetical protein